MHIGILHDYKHWFPDLYIDTFVQLHSERFQQQWTGNGNINPKTKTRCHTEKNNWKLNQTELIEAAAKPKIVKIKIFQSNEIDQII